jgi:SAM-dependent methyltransferase
VLRDIREGEARFYDLNPNVPKDIPFFLKRIPSPDARVLELGCGTGRVSIPVAQRCAFLYGLDLSSAMLEICRSKLQASGLGEERVRIARADICNFDLGQTFDLIIAPFRVVQSLVTDAQLAGMFGCIRKHLARSGRCVLNAFNPNRDPATMRSDWVSDQEELAWEVETPHGRVARYDVRRRIDGEPLVLYPDLVYRRFVGAELVEEVLASIPMRCHYPEDFLSRIESEGFRTTGKWGGYIGEEYGVGGELVVEFSEAY